jgi:Calcineurin-like phosphoesterase
MRARLALTATLSIVALVATADAQKVTLPMKDGSVRFAVIGDTGTGGSDQMRVAQQLAKAHQSYPFEFSVMLGDNMYGGEGPTDFINKFEKPYKPLLDGGVKFYAALGNHDDPNQRFYKLFNMNGERYYTFKAPRGSVRFFALDSNYVDKAQLAWLEKELSASESGWKIAFFHHPLYSSGEKHGSDTVLRDQLEPLFLKYGVDLVLSGHEHFYERLKPQKGINYIILGNSAKLRRGNIAETDIKAKGFDQGFTFMLVAVADNELQFQTIDDKGQTIDSGTMRRRETTKSQPQPK